MGSLNICLGRLRKVIDSQDAEDIRAGYRDYIEAGLPGDQAARRAVMDMIDHALSERAEIAAKIEKAGGVVPPLPPVEGDGSGQRTTEVDRPQVKPGDPEWDFIPNSGWRDHQAKARVYAAALRIPFAGLDTEAIVAAIDKKMAEHVGAPEGVSLMISDTTLDVEDARIKGGQYKAVAQRKSPWKSVDGYGANPLEAATNAVRSFLPAQTSLVPEATTGEKIKAAEKAKDEKGKASDDDAGPLFNPDAGKQADLVDLAKKPERTPSEIVGTLSSKAMAAKRMFDSDGNPIGTEPAKQPDAPKAETAETVAETADTKADSDPLAPLVVVLRGAGFKTIVEARKFVKELGILPADATNKQIDETVETAVVAAARQIVKQYGDAGHSPKSIFEQLTRLYGNQPNLASRTGTSVANQAYSTPMPLAYVASRLAGVQAAAEVYEPTAGNGALLIEADPTKTTANEIDPDRAQALKAQGFTVTSKDGAEIPTLSDIDSVIMNPPFGAVKAGGKSTVFQIGELTTTKIDHAVSLNALEAMADGGRAVLIIGGTKAEDAKERMQSYRGLNMKDSKTGKGRDNFYRVLYDRYNVTDHFTVSGDLYTKQGASWPVDVIAIEGRGKSKRPLPGTPQGVPALLKSWDELAEKIPNDAANDRTGDRPARNSVEPVERPAAVDEVRGEQDVGVGPVAGKPEKGTKPAGVRKDAARGQPEGGRSDAVGDGDVPAGGRGDGGRIDRDRAPRRERVKVKEGATQAKYEPVSSSKSVDTLVPASMVDSTRNAMERVDQRHGSVDDFVQEQLGYESDADGMYFIQTNPETGERVKKRPFSAEQIDAIALAIDNVERGDAIVVGDATGIGKGRIGAGMLRYAIKKGLVPVLMTEKMDLYGDMYRDMRDIGMFEMLGREPRILTTDVGKSIPLDEEAVSWKADMELAEEAGEPLPPRRGKFLSGGTSQTKDKAYDRLLAGDASVADVVFTTYSQMQTLGEGRATPRRRTVLDAIAPRAMMVLDETHNAGGQGVVDDSRGAKSAEGGRAEFVRSLAGKAKGLMFMSATYAKRPNVMDLYARTDMGKAVQDIKDLPTLIQRGGVPMQQIVASMLSESGQYLRRERSFDGIEYAVEEAKVDEVAYDQFVGSVQQIFKFDLSVKDTRDEIVEEILDSLGAGKKGIDGGVGDASARSTGFASIMHNIVSQMLLAIKADAAADRAIAALEAGEKPVITLANTNESFISDFASMDGTKIGGTLDIDFGSMLKRYLQRTLRITYKKAGDNKPSHYQIPIERLPASLQKAYRDVEALIDEGDYQGMPVSPIDWIRSRIGKAGYSVREVTGRKTMLDYSRSAPKLVVRPKGESGSSGKRVTLSKFNGGTLDVVILNQSGSTGVSMHSSETFADKRKRRMILAQAEANIDTHMQMLGRVNRTGQVVLPSYSQLAAGIPAETRPIIVLMKKMASLNASTTGARGSAFTAEAADFMNEVGDKVMAEYLWENPEINLALGEPYDGVEHANVVQKATGKLVLLTVAQQREMLETVQKNYVREIEQLDALGENPLEAKMLDLQAETLETVELKARTGDSPFLDAVRIEKVSAKAQGRAMPVSEVIDAVSERLKATKPEGSEQSALEALERKGREWMSGESRRVQDLARRQLAEELAETKPDSREGVRSRQLATLSRWQQTMNVAYPGARVSLGMPSGDLDGIVMSVERSGKAHGITALSAWTVKIAVPDSARQFEFPMSKLFPPGVTKSEDEKGATISSARTFFPMLIQAFEEARKEGREIRYIVTGNILGGYDQTKGKGRIVNFTTKDGQVRPGVLMERGFEVGKFMSGRAIRFGTGAQVVAFIDKVSDVEVSGRDGDLVLGRNRNGYYVQMAKARGKAGKYYTDKAVRAAVAPTEFAARGNKMMAEDLSRAKFVAVIDEMRKIGAVFETTTAQDEAQQIIAKIVTDGMPLMSITSETEVARNRRTISRLDYVKGRILLRQPVDLSEDADRIFDVLESEGSILPNSIPETVVTKLLPKLGSPGKYIVTVRDKNGTQYSYEDDSKLIPKTQGMYLLLGGRPAVTLLPLDFGGDFVKSVVGVRAHEAVHALRVNGFLPGNGRDLGSAWGRLVGHADVLGVLSMSRSELYERMGDPRSETASKEVTTLEVYTELYANRKYARELLDQEAVAHMVEVYKLGGWSEQEVAPIKDLLDDILAGRTGQQERASLSLDMLRSIQDTETGQSMRRDLDELGYYSKALEVARSLKQAKGTPEQMLAQLKSAGVKDAEIEATGLRGAIDGKKSVTRDEIVKHLEANRVGLREAFYKGPADYENLDGDAIEALTPRWMSATARAVDRVPGAVGNILHKLFAPQFERYLERKNAKRIPAGRAGPEKYTSHSLDPSNPTYRETVLHLPGEDLGALSAEIDALSRKQRRAGADVDEIQSEIDAITQRVRKAEADFNSGHFSEPNIVGHMMTSMTTHQGKPVFTIDQIQSDWGQKLRDGGGRDEAKIAELKERLARAQNNSGTMFADNGMIDFKEVKKLVGRLAEKVELSEAEAKALAVVLVRSDGRGEWGDGFNQIISAGRHDLMSPETAATLRPKLEGVLLDEMEQFRQDYLSANNKNLLEAELRVAEADVPRNPLVNTTDQWVNTVLRRAIRQAAEADADYLAIPHGDTVLSYNPGDTEGMIGFYGSRKREGIVPKNLRKLIEKLDKNSPKPQRVEKLGTSNGLEGYQDDHNGIRPSPDSNFDPDQTGFTLFALTDAVKAEVKSEGQPLFSNVPGKSETSAQDIEKAINDAVAIVSRIAGPGVEVVTTRRIPFWQFNLSDEQIEARAKSRGPRDPGGVYQQTGDAKAIITLAYGDDNYDIRTTAGHEAYHHVEEVLASPAELKLLRSPSEMERATRHAAAEIGMSLEETRKLPDYEVRAIAFQRYRRLREEGGMTPVHIGIRRAWDRFIRIFQSVKNALRGQGFDSMEAIFERTRSGEMVAAAAERTLDARAAERPAARRGRLDRQMVPTRYVEREPFDLKKVREVRRYTADVPLSLIRTVQDSVGVRSAKAKIRNPVSDGPVSLFKWDGLYYVNDGNHRIESEDARGASTIRAEVIELAPRGTDGTDVLAGGGLADAQAQRVGAQEDYASASQGALASFFPTATSSGTFFGRRIAAQMRRMAPASDQWRVRLQDKFLMVRREQEEIERKTGSSLPLPVDVYVAESLFHGRAGERMADLQQKRVEPLVEHLRTNEIDADELGEFLYARHAQERNAYIRTIDPANDAGSGMTDADAQAIIGRVQSGPKAKAYADAATMIDQINKETRDTLLSAGLITRETYDAWSNDYQHYVPLRGFEVNDEEQVFPRVGKGFNVRGPEAFQALGRRSKSDNPVAYVLLQAQQAIVRAEKNRVNKTLLRLVETHPDPDVWQVYRGEYKRVLKTDPATGQDYVDTAFVPPQFSAHDPSIVGVKVGGKQHYIQVHNPNLARALRGVGSSEFDHAIVRNMMALTRFYAQLLTSWNPEFVVGNFFRDVQAALINSKDVVDLPAGARKKMLAEALSLTSIRGIYNALRGDGSHPHAHYFEEFRQAGGKISFMEYSDVERIKSRINGLLTEGKTMRAIRHTAKYVEDVNTSVENGVRLSTYIAMREAGIARDRAASVARELTVNFNRKGEWGPIINAAYMFFNASVQGSTRMLQAIAKSKAVRRAVYAIAFGGLAMEMLNYIISGDDDDKENAYGKIKPWVKERNMIFMLPGRKDYLMIPMPYGYNVPYVAGQKIGEMARSAAGYGKTTPAKAAAGIMDAMMGSFNPLGTSPTTSFLQMMSPTILDPVVQVAENKSWFGGPIYPTKFDKNKPDSENYFANVHPAFIGAAKFLNSTTGGNAAKSGIVDVSPEVLEHYTTFLGGGVAKFLLNATGTGQRALAGEEFIPEKTPIVRRLYGSQTSTSRRSEFLDAWTKVDGAHYEVIQLNKAGDREGMERARTENKAELEAYGAMKSTQQALSKYNKLRTQIQLNREMPEAEKKTKLDEIKSKENELILRAMAVYNQAQKQKGSGDDRKLRLSDEESETNKQQLGGLMKLLGKSGIALTERQSSNVEDRRGDQVSDEDLRDAQIESIYDLLRDDQRMAQQRTGRELQEASEITRSVPRIPK